MDENLKAVATEILILLYGQVTINYEEPFMMHGSS